MVVQFLPILGLGAIIRKQNSLVPSLILDTEGVSCDHLGLKGVGEDRLGSYEEVVDPDGVEAGSTDSPLGWLISRLCNFRHLLESPLTLVSFDA